MMVMKVLVAIVMMMIPMKPSSMTVMMATIPPPPPRKEFPRQIFAYRRAFSLYVFFVPRGGGVFPRSSLPVLGFWGDDIHEGALTEMDQCGHTTWRRGLGLARARGRCGPLVAYQRTTLFRFPYFLMSIDMSYMTS
jgi:hypothetical protein